MSYGRDSIGRNLEFLGSAPRGVAASRSVYLDRRIGVRSPARHGQIHGLAVGREAYHTLVKRAVEFSLRRFGTLPVSLFIFGGEEDIRTFHARYLRLVGTVRLLVA